MKLAIVIISDPKSGAEEAAGRTFNALSLAQEAKRKGDDVAITFIGAGTRWPVELAKVGHPFHALYDSSAKPWPQRPVAAPPYSGQPKASRPAASRWQRTTRSTAHPDC
jgi:hypothetical protein